MQRVGVGAIRQCTGASRSKSSLSDSFYNEEQKELQKNVKKLIDLEINPHCDQWEKEQIFPAHQVFKKFGDAGFLGITKPVEYGGQGLDYKYNMAFIEVCLCAG